jgi:hypothetical protein
MTLTFTFVVAFSIMATAGVVVVAEVRDPEVDTSTIVQALLTLISGILGALLGLLAGRASGGTDLHRRPDDPLDDAPAD